MHDKKLYGTATIGTKGQIVIPAEAREALGLEPGDHLYVTGSAGKGVVVLLKEDKIEQFIEQMNIQVETFKSFKRSKKD